MGEVDVGGGESEGVAHAAAVLHGAAHAVGAAEEGGGLFHVALAQRATYARGADGVAVQQVGPPVLEHDAQFVGQLRQEGEVVVLPGAEASVIAQQEGAHVQFVVHQAGQLAGCQAGHFVGEGHHCHVFHPRRQQQP